MVRRPPGLRIDPGGIAKGLIADEAGRALPAGVRYAISCGGDLALGGEWHVDVAGAWAGEPVHRLRPRGGGVATSGIHQRLWDGGHHLLDPSTGRPAWTGLVSVTAVSGERARGRGARQDRAALGTRGSPPRCCAATAACSSTRIAASR